MTTQGSGTESAADFAHVEDGFERLWTPHRMAYILGEQAQREEGDGCPFCRRRRGPTRRGSSSTAASTATS